MCKVSVLVPVYNVQLYLRQCLDSILAQTLSDIEIICIDDGSTDESGKILDAYAARDSRFRVIHQANGGYGKAMNAGLRIAKGQYIGIVESDDFIAPDMYERLYRQAEEKHADIAKSNYYRYWTVPERKSRKENLLKNLPYGKAIHPWQYQRLFRIQPSVWSAIYNRDFLEKNAIRFLETPGAAYQDTSFSFKTMAAAGRVVLLKEALLYYRQDNGNSSVHSKEKAAFVRLEYEEINRFLEKNDAYHALYRVRNQAMLQTYLWNYVRLKEELCEQFLKDMRHDFLQLYRKKQLSMRDFSKGDAAVLKRIIRDRADFMQRERVIMPLRRRLPGKVYRALMIWRIAGFSSMASVVYRKIMRK